MKHFIMMVKTKRLARKVLLTLVANAKQIDDYAMFGHMALCIAAHHVRQEKRFSFNFKEDY